MAEHFHYPLVVTQHSTKSQFGARDQGDLKVITVRFAQDVEVGEAERFVAEITRMYEVRFPGVMVMTPVENDDTYEWDEVYFGDGPRQVFDASMFEPLDDAARRECVNDDWRVLCHFLGTGEDVTAILREHANGTYLIAYEDAEGVTHVPGRPK